MTQTKITQAPACGEISLADRANPAPATGAQVTAQGQDPAQAQDLKPAAIPASGPGLQTLRAGCDALAAVVQARGLRVHLTSAGAGLADGLSAIGLSVAQAELPHFPADAFPLPRALPQRAGMPTDRCDLVIRLDGAGGQALVWLELQDVPQGWGAQARREAIAPLARLLQSQLGALHQPAAEMAASMLALLERLREVDSTAAPHLLMGVLHFLAGQVPAPVEVTALRIAGLCDMPASRPARPDVSLNADGWNLLAQAGLGQAGLGQAGLAAADPAQADAAPSVPVVEAVDTADTAVKAQAGQVLPAPPATGLHPFACIHLLKHEFDVAEDDATGLLWFRPHGHSADWSVLRHATADGWTAIATEVLEKTMDIRRAFAEMHLIRRRDIATQEVAEIYDLHGLIWWLRESEAGLEARLDQGPWTLCMMPHSMTGKVRAAEAFMRLMPELPVSLHAQAHDWAARMAHSVQVKPVLVQAAE